MKATALAGGVGGAKLLVGLQQAGRAVARAARAAPVTAIINTGDDERIYGVHVSPDLDIVTYWLAGIADTERGWGVRNDTFGVMEGLTKLGHETWFRLGDRDFATCTYRTLQMSAGATLSAVTCDIAQRLGVTATILPMSDDPVRTRITTRDGRELAFQEYFVKERQEPDVAAVSFDGIDVAKPVPEVVAAIREAERVILCPSNPIVSIAPILGLPGVRDALHEHPRVIAVSPIVRGKALKGPADKLMRATGVEVTAAGVAGMYADFCDIFVVDSSDAAEADRVEHLGLRAVTLDTIMTDARSSLRLAERVLAL